MLCVRLCRQHVALPLAPAAHGKDPGSGNTVVPDPGKVNGFGDPFTLASDVTGLPNQKYFDSGKFYKKFSRIYQIFKEFQIISDKILLFDQNFWYFGCPQSICILPER